MENMDMDIFYSVLMNSHTFVTLNFLIQHKQYLKIGLISES